MAFFPVTVSDLPAGTAAIISLTISGLDADWVLEVLASCSPIKLFVNRQLRYFSLCSHPGFEASSTFGMQIAAQKDRFDSLAELSERFGYAGNFGLNGHPGHAAWATTNRRFAAFRTYSTGSSQKTANTTRDDEKSPCLASQ